MRAKRLILDDNGDGLRLRGCALMLGRKNDEVSAQDNRGGNE